MLTFCVQEFKEQRDRTIVQIKGKLAKNLDFTTAENISYEKASTLEPVLQRLQKHIDFQLAFLAEFSDTSLEPKPNDINIAFMNRQLQPLKHLLPKINIIITPDNFISLLAPSHYKLVDEKTTNLVLAEIDCLTQKAFFDETIKTNESWLWSINFIILLKKSFEEKKKKFAGYSYTPHLDIHDSDHIAKKKKFEDLFTLANGYLETGGTECFTKAEELYNRLEKEFSEYFKEFDGETKRQQLQRKKDFFLNLTTSSLQPQQSKSETIKKIVPLSDINPKTGQVRKDLD